MLFPQQRVGDLDKIALKTPFYYLQTLPKKKSLFKFLTDIYFQISL